MATRNGSPRRSGGSRGAVARAAAAAAALLVAAAVVAVAPAAAQSHRFPDVAPDHYAFEAVEWAAQVAVTNGYTDGTFKPERPLIKRHAVVFMERYYDEILQADESADFTRGDMMVLLKAINDGTLRGTDTPGDPAPGTTGADQSHRFPDVAPDHYAFEAVEWAAQVAVTNGYTDGTFKPEQPLIKRHAVVFMERYYDEILQADESADFTRGDMMVLLKAINDGTLRSTNTGTDTYKAVAAGLAHTCAIRADDTITCWGNNAYGQIDAPAGTYKAVTTGWLVSCAIRTDDTIACWGDNRGGKADPPEGTYQAVTAGRDFGCAIRTDDTIDCWGGNSNGEGDAPEGTHKAIDAGEGHSCAIRTDDTIACWGANDYIQAQSPEGTYKAVAAGRLHSCAIRTDDTIACWGLNINESIDEPGGTHKAIDASTGFLDLLQIHTCAIRTDDTIDCWGLNPSGLGQPDAPVGTYKAVTIGGLHACAIRTDGTIACWGNNDHGQTDSP